MVHLCYNIQCIYNVNSPFIYIPLKFHMQATQTLVVFSYYIVSWINIVSIKTGKWEGMGCWLGGPVRTESQLKHPF